MEIIVVPFPHPGHIFPATELSRRLAARNIHVTIFLPSTSNPSTLSLHPLITILEFPIPHPLRFPPGLLENTIPARLTELLTRRPVQCVIYDEMISWVIDTPVKFNIPAVAFFTSSAQTEAVDHAAPSLRHRGGGGRGGGPQHQHHEDYPRRPRGVTGTTGAAAMLFNTCDDLERQSIDKITASVGKPVWGVGPLLPAKFWAEAAGDARPQSSVSETDVLAWLDARPPRSVIYVSFGTLVAPTDDEIAELAAGLAMSGQPFVWVVQPGAKPHSPTGEPLSDGVASHHPEGEIVSAGEGEIVSAGGAASKGMVIAGWAPQMLILGHDAVGGFICHCGWNSTLEALACGVPVLAWPVRGDQFDNAKLVTDQLGAGCAVRKAEGEAVTKEDVVSGIERVLSDEEIKRGAAAARAIFAGGFPRSSEAALDAFVGFVSDDGSGN